MLFEYDDLYRLVMASSTAASSTPFREEYEYTSIGNIASTSANGAYTYGEVGYANPHAATLIDGTALTYDQNGNLTSYGTATFLYDYRNRLATSSNNVATTTYAYDHTFERVLKTSGGTDTYYPNDLYETDGTTATRYIFANGELVATMEATGTATTTTFIHPDHLGGTNVATDESGQVSQVLDYYPYGGQRIDTGSYNAGRTFIGERFDAESSLSYLNARMYDGQRGQFTTQDPVFWEVGLTQDGRAGLMNPQAQNSYAYALNNPIIYKDPNGRWYVEVSVGGQAMFITAETGFRFNDKGIDWFIKEGAGIGVTGPVEVSFSSGELKDTVSRTVSRDAKFMAIAGAGVSEEGTYDPDNPLSTRKDRETSYSINVGIGGSASQNYTLSVPVARYNSGQANVPQTYSTPQQNTLNSSTIRSVKNSLSSASRALSKGNIAGAKKALEKASKALRNKN